MKSPILLTAEIGKNKHTTHTANDMIRLPPFQTEEANDRVPPMRYLNFLQQEDRPFLDGKRYIAARQLADVQVIEIKGTFEADWSFETLRPDYFWLHVQFTGHSERDTLPHTTLSASQYNGFYSIRDTHNIQVKAGRTWIVLLGIKIDDTATFVSEWPQFEKPTTIDQPYFYSINVGYRVRQIFEKIQQCTDAPYSLSSHIRYFLCQLLDVYDQDLKDKARSAHKEDIVIYHEAIDYIVEHYMDEDINRDTIAKSLGITPRKLYRALQGRNTTINKAIQTIRLHKGREMLRKTDMAVDGIAFQLNFSTAKYFYRQFVQCFGHSPSKERELYQKTKKRKKR